MVPPMTSGRRPENFGDFASQIQWETAFLKVKTGLGNPQTKKIRLRRLIIFLSDVMSLLSSTVQHIFKFQKKVWKVIMRKGGNRSENAKNGVYDARKPAAGENFWGYMKILLKKAPLKCPRFFLRGGGLS